MNDQLLDFTRISPFDLETRQLVHGGAFFLVWLHRSQYCGETN